MIPGGFLLIDKPEGPTTFRLLSPLKRKWRGERVGHAGTLDSGASGLVIAGVGGATRLLSRIEAAEKEYTFRLHFGFLTATGDLTGEVTERRDDPFPSTEELTSLLPRFSGEILQVPPLYSALKLDGKRVSDRVRAGEQVTLPPRPVTVSALEFLGEPNPGEFDFRCVVSKGTYVRSLGRDLAAALGKLGTVSRIRRLRIGENRLESAWPWAREGEVPELLSPEAVLPLPRTVASSDELRLLRNGVRIDIGRLEGGSVLREEQSGFFVADRGEKVWLYGELTRGDDPFASPENKTGWLIRPRVRLRSEGEQ